MKLIENSLIKEKKSKFYGYLYEIDNKDDVKNIINDLKINNKGYRHIPYAYKINNSGGKSDDHEPCSVGNGLLNILDYNNLNNHLLLIIRYYGGTKLGASNLLRAYINSAKKCIKK